MKKILIVDDYPGSVFATRLTLGQQHQYTEAYNGKEAFDAIKHNNFDLIITDLNMPICNGIELAKNTREHGVDTPIIMMTTSKDEAKKEAAYEAGISLWLQKPYKIEELQAIVAKISNNELILDQQ